MAINLQNLAQAIVDGKRFNANDNLSFFIDCALEELCAGANYIRRELTGDYVDLCAIVSARNGRCPEDCKYCAQSVYNKTNCAVYEFMDPEKILNICKAHEKEGVDRFSIVTSGRVLDGQEFERAIKSIELMRAQCDIKLCASMGFLSGEQLQRLRDAGVTTYHHNIETSPSNFHNICTTHSIEQKLSTLKTIKEKGLRVCSGGIIGLGESWQDRIEMATTLAEYRVDSIPINALIPIPGTPLQDLPRLSENEILRTVAIFRYINPTAHIRLAAGRALMTDDGKRAFNAGANATITGNMLTTVACATIQSDRTMLKELGRRVKNHPNETTT